MFVIGSIFYVAMACLPYSGLYDGKYVDVDADHADHADYADADYADADQYADQYAHHADADYIMNNNFTTTPTTITTTTMAPTYYNDDDDINGGTLFTIFYVIASLAFVLTGIVELVVLRMWRQMEWQQSMERQTQRRRPRLYATTTTTK